ARDVNTGTSFALGNHGEISNMNRT
ncbi:conjugal transfer protein TraG, partial [Campylobacter jejuni]|nr:conjugal transfer protein TraG [Campylobacter jejuni]